MNKKILIGVGVLAAAGLAYYLWKKNEASENETKTGGEKKANAIGRNLGVNVAKPSPIILNTTYTVRDCVKKDKNGVILGTESPINKPCSTGYKEVKVYTVVV